MTRTTTILALVTVGCFLLTGCPKKNKDKPADKKPAVTKTDKKPAANKTDKKPAKAAPKIEAGKLAGVAECEAYLKAYNCYVGKLPEAGRAAGMKAAKMMVDAWSKVPKNMMAKSCKAGLDGLKKASAASPAVKKYWDGCF